MLTTKNINHFQMGTALLFMCVVWQQEKKVIFANMIAQCANWFTTFPTRVKNHICWI